MCSFWNQSLFFNVSGLERQLELKYKEINELKVKDCGVDALSKYIFRLWKSRCYIYSIY